jgi:AraC-like DNA-binding protein
MEKNCIMNDKMIEVSKNSRFHRLIARMPESAADYGMWIINGSEECVSHPVDVEKADERRFEFYSLSCLVRGKGKLRINNRIYSMEPGDGVLICPGDWHYYGGDDDFYVEDAVRFCGRIPDFMRKNGLIHSGVVHFGQLRKLLPIIKMAQSLSETDQLRAVLALQDLLVKLFDAGDNVEDPVDNLLSAIHSAPPEHWWSVAELAQLRGISIDRLRREFRRHTGMLPKNYLEQYKLRQAADHLLSSPESVAETALRFGYVDPYHFSRRFKHLFGFSPEYYRRMFAVSTRISDDKSRR